MNNLRENRIISAFLNKYFEQEIIWERDNENIWPDGIFKFNENIIALELTEILHKDDNLHTSRKKLASNESKLQNLIIKALNDAQRNYGGMLSVAIDLTKLKLNNSILEQIGSKIGAAILERIKNESIGNHQTTFNLKIPSLNAEIRGEISKKWNQIGCDVGFKGMILANMPASEIQKVIDRKNEPKEERNNYKESWLLLVEDLYGSMRDNIETEGQFNTWYDRIFLFRLVDDDIIELKKTITNKI